MLLALLIAAAPAQPLDARKLSEGLLAVLEPASLRVILTLR